MNNRKGRQNIQSRRDKLCSAYTRYVY